MLGIVAYDFGYQESIAAISLILSTENDGFKVDLRFFRKK